MIRYFWGRLLAAFTVLVALVVALLADDPPAAVQLGPPGGQWTATWSTSKVAATPDIFGMPNWSGGFSDQSVRQPVRASRGGSAVRIRISNVFGTGPLRLAGASIGRAAAGAAVQPGTLQALSFGGHRPTTVPAGRELDSDLVPLTVAALERLTVTLYFPAPTGPASFHPSAIATSYRSAGNHLADPAAQAFGETSQSWYYLSGLDVTGAAPPGDRGTGRTASQFPG